MEYVDLAVRVVPYLLGGAVAAVGAWYGMRDSLKDGARAASDASAAAKAAHATAKAAHVRVDDHERRLIGLEKDQSFHAKRLEESLGDIRGDLKELRASIDRLAERGVHCGHCKGED